VRMLLSPPGCETTEAVGPRGSIVMSPCTSPVLATENADAMEGRRIQ